MRAEDCVVSGCPRKASASIHVVPMCQPHGYEIALGFRADLLAIAQHDERTRHAGRTEKIQAAAGNREGSLVYYVRIGDYIKIGFSTRLRNRLASLRADELLAIEPGGPEIERERHQDFARERIDLRRENFRPSEALENHIKAMRERYGLPYWATLPRTTTVTTRKVESA